MPHMGEPFEPMLSSCPRMCQERPTQLYKAEVVSDKAFRTADPRCKFNVSPLDQSSRSLYATLARPNSRLSSHCELRSHPRARDQTPAMTH
jgi:hypothetical protein